MLRLTAGRMCALAVIAAETTTISALSVSVVPRSMLAAMDMAMPMAVMVQALISMAERLVRARRVMLWPSLRCACPCIPRTR